MAVLPYYLCALVSVLLTTLAQLLLKSGVMAAMAQPRLDDGAVSLIRGFLVTPALWAGIVTMGLSVLTWMAALSRLEVSRAYPFTSLGIVLTMLGGRFLFQEPLSAGKLVGGAIIVIGVVSIARS